MTKKGTRTRDSVTINFKVSLNDDSQRWFEPCISFWDAQEGGNEIDLSLMTTGSVIGSVKKIGSAAYESFGSNPDIVAGEYSYRPELFSGESFKFEFSDLPANVWAEVSINNWR